MADTYANGMATPTELPLPESPTPPLVPPPPANSPVATPASKVKSSGTILPVKDLPWSPSPTSKRQDSIFAREPSTSGNSSPPAAEQGPQETTATENPSSLKHQESTIATELSTFQFPPPALRRASLPVQTLLKHVHFPPSRKASIAAVAHFLDARRSSMAAARRASVARVQSNPLLSELVRAFADMMRGAVLLGMAATVGWAAVRVVGEVLFAAGVLGVLGMVWVVITPDAGEKVERVEEVGGEEKGVKTVEELEGEEVKGEEEGGKNAELERMLGWQGFDVED